MTKTTLLLLLGGLCAAAALRLSDTPVGAAPAAQVAWEQPPGVPPRPGGGIIIKAGDEAAPGRIAWEQPPGVPPRPGGGIIIKAVAPSGDLVA